MYCLALGVLIQNGMEVPEPEAQPAKSNRQLFIDAFTSPFALHRKAASEAAIAKLSLAASQHSETTASTRELFLSPSLVAIEKNKDK